MQLETIFGTARPVIAMLHVPGLPGRPRHDVAGGLDRLVDVLGRDPGGIQRAARRVLRQIDRGLAVGSHVTPLDTGARTNPFVAGLDHLLEVEIGEDFLGQVRAGAGDARVDQAAAPGASSACAM